MILAGRNADNGGDDDAVRRLAHLEWIDPEVEIGAVPELTVPVVAPRPDGSVRSQRERVIVAGGDRHDLGKRAPVGELHPRRVRSRNRRSVTKLAVLIHAPRPDGA